MVKRFYIQFIRLLYLFGGLFIAALGSVLVIEANFGVDSWSVLHIGITLHTPFTIGQACQLLGIIIILASLFLKIKPGFCTIMNMFFYGYFVDLIMALNFIKQPNSIILTLVYLVAGTIIFGIGIGVYINSNFGAGPRDGLMLGLSKLTGKSVAFIKTLIELTVITTGFFLGGPVGIGTLIFAISVGHVIEWSLNSLKLPSSMIKTRELQNKTSI